jgi:predicted  nucleic acid-binding Zn-ribbon protein
MEELRSLADLLELQVVDLQIDRLLHERESLPELEQYRAAHQHAESVGAALVTAEAELRQTALDLDKTEGELEITTEREGAEQNRLYAGGISARDADYLRREVEMLGRKRREMEDSALELMETRENQDAAVTELRGNVEEATSTKTALEAAIKEVWRGIDAQIATKEARKAGIAPSIPEDLLELYEDLRGSKEGVAVGELSDGICGGCHLRLTAAEVLEAKRSDPARCIHCRRILVT